MEENQETKTLKTLQEIEYLKLTKNTKGYNWEIKVCMYDSSDNAREIAIKRLEIFDSDLKERFGKGKKKQ